MANARSYRIVSEAGKAHAAAPAAEAAHVGDYRIYCLDRAGKIASAEWLQAKSDQEALGLVRSMKLPVPCEVWQLKRRVGLVAADCGD